MKEREAAEAEVLAVQDEDEEAESESEYETETESEDETFGVRAIAKPVRNAGRKHATAAKLPSPCVDRAREGKCWHVFGGSSGVRAQGRAREHHRAGEGGGG